MALNSPDCRERPCLDRRGTLQVDGTVLDFGMLPDGLKSIVSWVSDLLMRLDETPWVNDTPVLERSFLLARWGSRSRPGPT
jgi:hypothetical protein